MRLTPEQSGVSVVLVGSINPAIFHPEWFRSRDLITREDAEKAEIQVIAPDLTIFSLPWANLQIERDKFVIQTTTDPFVRVQDLLMKVFLDQLPHTPLTQLAINRAAHFRVESREAQDRVGFTLAPLEVWGEWAKDLADGGHLHGGMRSLTMEQSSVKDRDKGFIRATVQPSVRFVPGIWIEVNDHYEVNVAGAAEGAIRVMETIHAQFDTSIARSEWIMDQVLRLL